MRSPRGSASDQAIVEAAFAAPRERAPARPGAAIVRDRFCSVTARPSRRRSPPAARRRRCRTGWPPRVALHVRDRREIRRSRCRAGRGFRPLEASSGLLVGGARAREVALATATPPRSAMHARCPPASPELGTGAGPPPRARGRRPGRPGGTGMCPADERSRREPRVPGARRRDGVREGPPPFGQGAPARPVPAIATARRTSARLARACRSRRAPRARSRGHGHALHTRLALACSETCRDGLGRRPA